MKEDITEDLLIRYVLDEASIVERQQVESWLDGEDAHIKHLEHVKFLLDHSKQLAQKSPLSTDEAWEKFKVRRENYKPAPVRVLSRYNRWLQVAAVLILGGALWLTWHYGHQQRNEWTTVSAYDKVVTDTLPDGSVIQLNKNSNIRYAGRTVYLNGEAFFKVIHNTNKPFVVHAADISITDIGTAFNVRSAAGKVEVIVESGIVQVQRKTGSVVLKEKQMVLIQPESALLQPEANNDLLYQYYRTGEFVNDHTPLGHLVNVLNEAYGADIRIEGKALADLPVTATFKKESLDKILQVLLLTTPEIHRVNRGNTIILTR
jgi:ferric-dicitrate binding protein FerR (iron transport regulator)